LNFTSIYAKFAIPVEHKYAYSCLPLSLIAVVAHFVTSVRQI